MEVLDVVIERQYILTPTIVTNIVFMKEQILKCMQVMEDMDICLLIPANLPLSIVEFIIVLTMVEVDLGIKRPANISLTTVEFIILLLAVEVGIGLNIPATLPVRIVDQESMLTGEVDIGLRPSTLSPITQMAVVYFVFHQFLLFLLAKTPWW